MLSHRSRGSFELGPDLIPKPMLLVASLLLVVRPGTTSSVLATSSEDPADVLAFLHADCCDLSGDLRVASLDGSDAFCNLGFSHLYRATKEQG